LIIGAAIVLLLNSIIIPNSLRRYVQNKKIIDTARRVQEKYAPKATLDPNPDAPEQSGAPKSRN
jgi:hypothetical protein